jgi:hypothetical protein
MKKIFMFVVLLVNILAPQLVSAQFSATIATVPNPATICAGQGTNVSLTATGTGGPVIGYAWSNGGNTQAINVSPGATTTYTVTITFLGGATANANQAVTVIAAPSQATITPAGPTTVCTGNTVQLDASIADTWQWYLSGGPIPGATSQTYIAGASGDYTVMGTIGNCTTPMSNPTTVSIIPLPTANVTPAGPLTTCYGTPITLTADFVPSATYQWQYSINGNPPWSNVLGETNQTYNATVTGWNRVAVSVGACTNYSN